MASLLYYNPVEDLRFKKIFYKFLLLGHQLEGITETKRERGKRRERETGAIETGIINICTHTHT